MTETDRLIRMNVELEGLLKVLRDRDSLEARSLLSEKIKEYTSAIEAYLAAPLPQKDEKAEEAIVAGSSAIEETQSTEVKTQEAQETEVEPEAEAAEEAVAHETEPDHDIYAAHRRYMPPETPAHTPKTNSKLLKAFTLNDRFRFCRELFGGDDADFTETLKLIADMDSYDEACDYLYNDMMWDRTDPNVEAFMAIVADNIPQ